jgi:Tfp pilus assembly PilM family ATPase
MVRTVTRRTNGRAAARGAILFLERGARIAVLARHKGRPAVAELIEVKYPTAAAGQSAPLAQKVAAVRDALRAHKWTGGGMALVLPKNIVTMRLVTLPSTDDAELAEMARFEAQKHIPFNAERHVISHAVLRKEGVEGSRTLVVAVDRAALEEPLAICREAKIDLVSAGVSSLALVEALLLHAPTDYERRTFGVVNVGWSTVDITIVSNGIVRFTRSGAMGVDRIAPVLEEMIGGKTTITPEVLEALDALAPEAFTGKRDRMRAAEPQRTSFAVDDFEDESAEEQRRAATRTISVAGEEEGGSAAPAPSSAAADVTNWLGRIVQEIKRTYTFAAREFDCPELDMVYLSGVGAGIANIDRYLAHELRGPVQVIAPPDALVFLDKPGANLRAQWNEYAVVIGAAVGRAVPDVSLLPPEYTEAVHKRRRRHAMIVTGVLAFVLLATSATYGFVYLRDQRDRVRFYLAENARMKPEVRRLRDSETRLKVMSQIVADKLSALDVLKAVGSFDMMRGNRPRVALTDFHYIKGSKLTLQGHALTYEDMTNYVGALRDLKINDKQKMFEEVTPKKSEPTSLPLNRVPKDVIQFTIDCTFPATPAQGVK